jgi:hypothetical protein
LIISVRKESGPKGLFGKETTDLKERNMNMSEVRELARTAGVAAGKMRKAELIRVVQRTEGNQDCFGAEWRYDCSRLGCCWRADCLTKNPG